MQWPRMVLPQFCTTEIHLEIDREGLNKYGEPLEPVVFAGKCNYQDKARTVLTAEKKLVEITGSALIPGDVCPDLPVISDGTAVVHGVKRRIQQGKKARNPDGTVNFTEVLLI